MSKRRRRSLHRCLVVALAVAGPSVAATAIDSVPATAQLPEETNASRLPSTDSMANECRAVYSLSHDLSVIVEGSEVESDNHTNAEPYRLQATDLSRYLLVDSDGRFLAGRGGDVVVEATPGPTANWRIDSLGDAFALRLPSTGQTLVMSADGSLAMVDGGHQDPGSRFILPTTSGCTTVNEAELNVSGPHLTGSSPDAEVVGYLDAHLHITGYASLGGKIHCGQPWHPYGVTYALVDCADHEIADGAGAVLENFLSDGSPVGEHDPVGWPTFRDWPAPKSLTHEQTYYRWIERSWRGGVRVIVNLLVENRVICEIYPLKQNTCDPMTSIRQQAQRLRDLERYIDAQSGGAGQGWFRIVDDPAEARAVANRGDLAVILGMEASEPFGCRILMDLPLCSEADIDRELDELYDLGVRQITPIHKFDNALGGVAGDGGTKGAVINVGNLASTGEFWDFETCDPHDTGVHDNDQELLSDTGEITELVGDLLVEVSPVALPIYPARHHCNTKGLTDLGAYTLSAMEQRGMIIDLDHMSVLARQDSLDLLEASAYPGVISSHSWATPDAYPRIYALGGMTAPYAGGSEGFVAAWRDRRADAGNPADFGLGFGADSNGLAPQGGPRGADAENAVQYPFTGLGGVVVDRQVTGERVFDINIDGVAHYGLYPDWVEDLRLQAGDEIVEDLSRGAETYLQMWEAAIAVSSPPPEGPSPDPSVPTPVDDPGEESASTDDDAEPLPATGGSSPLPLAIAAAVTAVLVNHRRKRGVSKRAQPPDTV